MQNYYLRKDNLKKVLDSSSDSHDVYVPVAKGQNYYIQKYSGASSEASQPLFNEYRTVEPLKSFLYPAQSRVAAFFGPEEDQEPKPQLILGVKSCDLFSLKIQDFVFKDGQVSDPSYIKRRERMLIIASDCAAYKEVCFCLALGIKPYPEADFDLNLSPLIDGYVVTVGSEKGKEFISKNSSYFESVTHVQLSSQKINRQNLITKLKAHLEPQKIPSPEFIPQVVKRGYGSNIWKEEVLTCVECGACNFICCTCHCFLLSDQPKDTINERFRSWDACLYQNFARVAGGANPMKRRFQRLRNRYIKKFNFFPDNINLNACTGCGRCVETCPAKIDIRRILKNLGIEAEHAAKPV